MNFLAINYLGYFASVGFLTVTGAVPCYSSYTRTSSHRKNDAVDITEGGRKQLAVAYTRLHYVDVVGSERCHVPCDNLGSVSSPHPASATCHSRGTFGLQCLNIPAVNWLIHHPRLLNCKQASVQSALHYRLHHAHRNHTVKLNSHVSTHKTSIILKVIARHNPCPLLTTYIQSATNYSPILVIH